MKNIAICAQYANHHQSIKKRILQRHTQTHITFNESAQNIFGCMPFVVVVVVSFPFNLLQTSSARVNRFWLHRDRRGG